jgi:hypothetical protein
MTGPTGPGLLDYLGYSGLFLGFLNTDYRAYRPWTTGYRPELQATGYRPGPGPEPELQTWAWA